MQTGAASASAADSGTRSTVQGGGEGRLGARDDEHQDRQFRRQQDGGVPGFAVRGRAELSDHTNPTRVRTRGGFFPRRRSLFGRSSTGWNRRLGLRRISVESAVRFGRSGYIV